MSDVAVVVVEIIRAAGPSYFDNRWALALIVTHIFDFAPLAPF